MWVGVNAPLSLLETGFGKEDIADALAALIDEAKGDRWQKELDGRERTRQLTSAAARRATARRKAAQIVRDDRGRPFPPLPQGARAVAAGDGPSIADRPGSHDPRWEQDEQAISGHAWVTIEMILRVRGETALADRVADVIEQRRQR